MNSSFKKDRLICLVSMSQVRPQGAEEYSSTDHGDVTVAQKTSPEQAAERYGKVPRMATITADYSWMEMAKLRSRTGIKLVSPAVAGDIEWLKVSSHP
jgi:hypothetical protein